MPKSRRNNITDGHKIHNHNNSNGNGNTNNTNGTHRLGDYLNPQKTTDELSLLNVLSARTPNQKKYIKAINDNYIVFATGDSGAGKSHIASGMAATYLANKIISRIIVIRPMVSCDEDMGYLPGNLQEKMSPYTRPIFDEFSNFFSNEDLGKLLQGYRPIIEVASLGTVKGRTFKNSFVIVDEAQDATYKQLKTIITRLGENSKLVINGDTNQSDLSKDFSKTPLEEIIRKLDGIEGICHVRLNPSDIQRHPLIAQIIERI